MCWVFIKSFLTNCHSITSMLHHTSIASQRTGQAVSSFVVNIQVFLCWSAYQTLDRYDVTDVTIFVTYYNTPNPRVGRSLHHQAYIILRGISNFTPNHCTTLAAFLSMSIFQHSNQDEIINIAKETLFSSRVPCEWKNCFAQLNCWQTLERVCWFDKQEIHTVLFACATFWQHFISILSLYLECVCSFCFCLAHYTPLLNVKAF